MAKGFDGQIGLALGSGAARGWAHVGVIRALEQAGVRPEVVCGTSSGAIVGGLYAAGRLDALESWARQLDRRKVLSLFDFSMRGGLIKARRLFDALGEQLGDPRIESLPLRFGAVATDLATGREIWLREGSLLDALRASIALPGVVTPAEIDGRWLVDGGLVNAVPISLCRALGADSVIAVDLNTALLRRRFMEPVASSAQPEEDAEGEAQPGSVRAMLQDFLADVRGRMGGADAEDRPSMPSLFDVIANSINIMQVRVTRSRMAGDPPDLLVTPNLAQLPLLAFDRAAEAIEEGRRAAHRALTVWESPPQAPAID